MEIAKIYNVIGHKTNGVLTFKYNLKGVLVAFELTDCDEMTPIQRTWLFSHHFPYKESQIKNFKAIKEFTVSEGEFKLDFEMFWKAYKYKVKKEMSLKAWSKLTDSDKMKAIAGIRGYEAFLFRKRNQAKAYPSTYLNQKYWNDEYEGSF